MLFHPSINVVLVQNYSSICRKRSLLFGEVAPPRLIMVSFKQQIVVNKLNSRSKREADVNSLINSWAAEPGDAFEKIKEKKFTAISVEYAFKTDRNKHVPIEIGLANFSINDGVCEPKKHFFVKARSLQGYVSDAKFYSEQRHKIPFTGHPEAEFDYTLCLNKVFDAVQISDDGDGLLFCLAEEFKPVVDALQYLADNCVDTLLKRIRLNVMCVEDWALAFRLFRDADFPVPLAKEQIANLMFRTIYDFVPGTRCSFHDRRGEVDVPFCAIGTVHRIWFHMNDYVVECGQIEEAVKSEMVRKNEKEINFSRSKRQYSSEEIRETFVRLKLEGNYEDQMKQYAASSWD